MLVSVCFGFCHDVWEKSGRSCLLSMNYLTVFHPFVAVLNSCVGLVMILCLSGHSNPSLQLQSQASYFGIIISGPISVPIIAVCFNCCHGFCIILQLVITTCKTSYSVISELQVHGLGFNICLSTNCSLALCVFCSCWNNYNCTTSNICHTFVDEVCAELYSFCNFTLQVSQL